MKGYEFGKCDHCGTWHIIETGSFAEIVFKTCPHVAKDQFFYTGISDPDDERAISATFRGPARPD